MRNAFACKFELKPACLVIFLCWVKADINKGDAPYWRGTVMRNDRSGIALKCMILLVFFVVMSCAALTHAAEWTFMVYIGGDNSLSEAAVSDIEEMSKAVGSADVNIIVQVELGSKYTLYLPSYIPDYNTYRLRISNGQVQSFALGQNLDMADPDTLKGFIQWGASAYPAQKYALIIWDHGAGWKGRRGTVPSGRGAVEDETSGSFMTLAQLGKAVKDSGTHIHLLDFDACLMAMYEVAYEFNGYADYLVSSEETEPNEGNPYTLVLNSLSANPSMSAKELAQVFVSKYNEFYQGTRESVTLSAIDISQVQTLHQLVLDFVSAARSNMPAYWSAISLARNNAQHYTYKSNTDMIGFLNNLKTSGGSLGSKASDLSDFLLNKVIISNIYYSGSGGNFSDSNVDGSHGLAIFFPNASTLQQGEMSKYALLSSNTGQQNSWYALINDFLSFTGNAGSGATMVAGEFAYAAAWLNRSGGWGDADVDIYIYEPDGNIGSPWMGQSTTNGYFSPESSASDNSYEMYTSKASVMAGDYFVIVNYYLGGYFDSEANVYILYMDYQQGVRSWQLIPGQYLKRMSLLNPAPYTWDDTVITNIINGYYSDWWIPVHTTKAINAMPLDQQREMLMRVRAYTEEHRGKNKANNLLKLFGTFNAR